MKYVNGKNDIRSDKYSIDEKEATVEWRTRKCGKRGWDWQVWVKVEGYNYYDEGHSIYMKEGKKRINEFIEHVLR